MISIRASVVAILLLSIVAAAQFSEAVKVNSKSQQRLRAFGDELEVSSDMIKCFDSTCPSSPAILERCYNCYISVFGVLNCYCIDDQGREVQSTLQNAWACNACIHVNSAGELICKMPTPAEDNPYTNFCTQCGVAFDDLRCERCDFGGGVQGARELENACLCETSVSYNPNTFQMSCLDPPPTSSPTNPPNSPPTISPTSTPAPTPAGPPTQCSGSWNQFTTERAPWKYCGSNDDGAEYFTSRQGCQNQNYCCWQQTGSNSGICYLPRNTDVECPSLSNNRNACNSALHCTYEDRTQMCRRTCPGDSAQLCDL